MVCASAKRNTCSPIHTLWCVHLQREIRAHRYICFNSSTCLGGNLEQSLKKTMYSWAPWLTCVLILPPNKSWRRFRSGGSIFTTKAKSLVLLLIASMATCTTTTNNKNKIRCVGLDISKTYLNRWYFTLLLMDNNDPFLDIRKPVRSYDIQEEERGTGMNNHDKKKKKRIFFF